MSIKLKQALQLLEDLKVSEDSIKEIKKIIRADLFPSEKKDKYGSESEESEESEPSESDED
jgi:hypothetical protein